MKTPVPLHQDSYDSGYDDGRRSLLPLLEDARKRIFVLTAWSHEYDDKCLCSDCKLYKRLVEL